MVTSIDKALQDFVISFIALMAALGWDFSQWQGVAIALAGAFGKSFVTWIVPNRT